MRAKVGATLWQLRHICPVLKLRWIGLGLVLASCTAQAQVVNVERLRLDEQVDGYSGSVAGNVDLRQNQRRVFTAGLKAHVQLQRDSNTTLLVAQTGLVKASGSDFVNFAFAHLRRTQHLRTGLAGEAFTQLQQNRVNGIASRWLIGAGLRVRLLDAPNAALYVGSLLMHEREVETNDAIAVHQNWRLSNYLAASYTPRKAEWLSLTTTTYYQPRLGKWADFRMASESNLQVEVTKRLALTTTFNLFYDARPPLGLERTTFALLNGFKWTFG